MASGNPGLQKEINPLFPIIAGIVVVGLVVWFVFLKPGVDEKKALAEFNTPEAQAKRDPDTRSFKPETQALIEKLRAKEQHGAMARPKAGGRRRDEP